jgi:hypothetical protein
MITNDQELKASRERLEQFQDWLARMRQGARPEEWAALSSGYRLEIERMQAEILDYLLHPAASGREALPA